LHAFPTVSAELDRSFTQPDVLDFGPQRFESLDGAGDRLVRHATRTIRAIDGEDFSLLVHHQNLRRISIIFPHLLTSWIAETRHLSRMRDIETLMKFG
jgi:hypothetical protein